MKVGAMNHPAKDPLGEIEWIGKNAFDFVDFTLEPPAADPEQIDPRAVHAALERHRLGVVAHTAWYLPFGTPSAASGMLTWRSSCGPCQWPATSVPRS